MLNSLGIEIIILIKDVPDYNMWPLAEAMEGRDLLHENIVELAL